MKTKTLLVLVAVAGLSGCAVYPAPGYDGYGYGGSDPAYVTTPAPVYIQGSAVYRHSSPSYGPTYPRGYRQHPGHGPRDRDRDGIPNYRDRDRDGDGARNRHDRNPNDPRVR
ncbi:MAG: hypothetical protein M3R45_04780 [Pseudomonadota bacterium]|nr:hypothetical protein [Pseudomonadota bacterium]